MQIRFLPVFIHGIDLFEDATLLSFVLFDFGFWKEVEEMSQHRRRKHTMFISQSASPKSMFS